MNLRSLYNHFGNAIRKANAPRRFDREKAMQPLLSEIGDYWTEGIDAMFSYISKHEGWSKIQRHIQLELATAEVGKVRKALTDSDRQFIANLLVNFSYFDDAAAITGTIMQATGVDTFEAAAKFALQQIGVGSPDFELKNEAIREKLVARADAALFATRNHIGSTFDTIINQFYDLGRNPYNQEFVNELRDTLNVKTDWEAKRFSLTETGIASELAQFETYSRNGVPAGRWNITGANTRETHADLSGVEIPVGDKFDVGGFPANHPLDPTLPGSELINCHCWYSPVVGDDFQLDPSKIWGGA